MSDHERIIRRFLVRIGGAAVIGRCRNPMSDAEGRDPAGTGGDCNQAPPLYQQMNAGSVW